jgi:hypothetical protein
MKKFTIEEFARFAPLFDGPSHTAGPGAAEASATGKLTRLARNADRLEEARTVGLTTAEWFALDETERGEW